MYKVGSKCKFLDSQLLDLWAVLEYLYQPEFLLIFYPQGEYFCG